MVLANVPKFWDAYYASKVANDIEVGPQFGAGSEYGREQKQEARRKKYGISKKSYSPEDQPWLLKLGSGKNGRKFKVGCKLNMFYVLNIISNYVVFLCISREIHVPYAFKDFL